MSVICHFHWNNCLWPFLVYCWLNTGCAPTLYWVHESSSLTSCQPDRLLQWTDFKLRVPKDKRGAETAIRFFLHPSERRVGIAFDHEHSWVKPELVAPKDPIVKRMSEQLLAHEQVHFLISCLMVRKANLSLTEQDDLLEILHLTNLEAQRLNLQYDAATNHGLNGDVQQIWEAEVMRQLKKFRK